MEHLELARRAGWLVIGTHGFRGRGWRRNGYRAAWSDDDLQGGDGIKAVGEADHACAKVVGEADTNSPDNDDYYARAHATLPVKRESVTVIEAFEAAIGHMTTDGHLGRNFLKDRLGDQANAVLTAVGYNLRLILTWLRALLRKILEAILAALSQPLLQNPAC